ncbi:MAG TPA: DUF4397 domain-containing protein, partial [Phototrophicaceae bacterium]|nr:DUF4397 domain-containing protein [Phototrophicaceae bacterium]
MRWLSRLTILLLALTACAPSLPTATPPPAATTTPLPPAATTTPAKTAVPAPTATPVGQTTVRIIHAAPDTPTVNVFAGQSAIATNLEFSKATEATPINAERYTLRVVPTGAAADSPSLAE